ncbi:MAG: glycosyltransferase family 39 protein [Acidobacteria bacterium]|nr:glycosyltransferase family 39 protein [Acidobacteriota bacterium]
MTETTRARLETAGVLWAAVACIGYAYSAAATASGYLGLLAFGSRRWWVVMGAAFAALCLIASVLVLQRRRRSLPIVPLGLALLIAVGLCFVVLSGSSRAAAAAVWLSVLAVVWGDWWLRLGKAEAAPGERISVSFGLGLAQLALVGLALGIAGGLRTSVIFAVLGLLTVLQIGRLQRLASTAVAAARDWRAGVKALSSHTERAAVVFLAALTGFFALVWALTPETNYDALNYQIAVPRFYLEQGRIIDLPYFWHSYFVRLVNMLFTLAMAMGGAGAAKLLVWIIGAALVSSVYALAKNIGGQRAGMWAGALFAATPMVVWLSTTTYVDLPLTFFIAACWLAFLRWRETRARAWLWACGALAGAAVGTKMNGGYALPVVGLAVLWSLCEKNPSGAEGGASRNFPDRLFSARLFDLACFAAVALLTAGPWYALTWAQTGNPVFPLLNGVFRSPMWEPVNEMMNAGLFGVGASPGGLLRLPFALTYETKRFDELIPSGGVGAALVLLPAAIALLRVHAPRVWLMLAGAAVYLALWAFTFQYARYYIPALPLITALSVAGLAAARERMRERISAAVLWVALLAQGCVTAFAFGDFISMNPVARLIGRESEDAYLERRLGPFAAVKYLNSTAPADEPVVGVGVESTRYYMRAPLHSASETRELRLTIHGVMGRALAEALVRAGYRRLLINREDRGPHKGLFYLDPAFLERFATLEFRANGTEVYRLKAGE